MLASILQLDNTDNLYFTKFSSFLGYFYLNFSKFFDTVIIKEGCQLSLCLKNPQDLINLLLFFKLHTMLQFKSLLDIICLDFLKDCGRFILIYHLLSLRFNLRINLQIMSEFSDILETASLLYNSANWLEREVWDMFGVFFLNHFDLRRILTDYGFESFPLRKDFPLVGFVEVFYDEVKKRILFNPVCLVQGFRAFDLKLSF